MTGYRFNVIDTWYFKEARPMEGFGGMELSSVFPPPVRTLLGALRTAAGDAAGVDWSRYPNDYPELKAAMGDASGYGGIEVDGVFPTMGESVLFPLPLHIVHRNRETFSKMRIGDSVECDLGEVRLPELPTDASGERFEVFDETVWVTHDDLVSVLAGGVPKKVWKNEDLAADESRVGIARDNRTRTVREGMLYMTRHIRPKQGVGAVICVSGFEGLVENGLVRLGGEGRGAHFRRVDAPDIPAPTVPASEIEGVFFSLLTPGLVDPLEPLGEAVTSACIGKSYLEGGFDMHARRSRAARSYLPAGSAWFVSMDKSAAAEFIKANHDRKIGEETELGRGRIVCGYWISSIPGGKK